MAELIIGSTNRQAESVSNEPAVSLSPIAPDRVLRARTLKPPHEDRLGPRPILFTDCVLNGLVERGAELAGEIESTHKRLSELLADLETVDGTIRQFDQNYRVEAIRPKAFRPPKDWANKGQMSRIILSILRQAAEPMTTRDIALELLVSRAMDRSDQRLLRLMSKRVGVALQNQRDNGTVRSTQGAGMYLLWEVVK